MNFIKQYKTQFFILLPILVMTFIGIYYFNERNISRAEERMGATSVLMPVQGGTGTSTIPTFGQVLVGQANGKYAPVATSSLGIITTETDPIWTSVSTTVPYLATNNIFTATNTFNAIVGTDGATFAGNIGIGTTTSIGKLNIQTSGTSDALKIFETGGTEILTVRENGNVGIGRTAPDYPLEVNGNISIYDTANTVKGVRLMRNGQVLGGFNTDSSIVSFYGSAGNGLMFTVSSTVNVMKIFPNGNINIGNVGSNPTAKLDIYSTVGNLTDETNYAIKIRDVAGTIGVLMGVNVTSGVALFQSMDPGTSWGTKNMAVQYNGGNFGVGTTTPKSKLQITETGTATTTMWIGSFGQVGQFCLGTPSTTASVCCKANDTIDGLTCFTTSTY